jgi:hypothetical protein
MNVSKSLRRAVSATLPALWAMTLSAGCAEYQQQLAVREAASNVIVTPGDINRQYDILGTIHWPGAGYTTLFGTPCAPEKLREEAFARWGYSVSAIIGYTSWKDGAQIQCSGAAVRFR